MGLKALKQKKDIEAEVALKEIASQAFAAGITAIDNVATYANKGYYLEFARVADPDYSVRFYASMESFNDSYSSNFNRDAAFGRTDGIASYQNTYRTIGMSWVLTAHNKERAAKNLNDVKGLVNMLYPGYTTHGSQRVFSTAPLIGLRFINLAHDHLGGVMPRELLSGYMTTFTHTPDMEFGVFEEPGVILPKIIRLTCNFDVLHTETLGFNSKGIETQGIAHPYNNYFTDKDGNQNIPFPGNPSKVDFDKQYFNGFKDESNPYAIDPDLMEIWQNREKQILERQEFSTNPFKKLLGQG